MDRFWLEKRYPNAETYPRQAEYGVQKLRKRAAERPEYAVLEEMAREWLVSAKSEHEAYLDAGEPTDGLLRAALRLAKIDAVHRGAYFEGIGNEPPDDAVADLRALWAVTTCGDLADIRPPMQLNPEFGATTGLVRGLTRTSQRAGR